MKFEFYLPVKPFVLTQTWGVFHEDPQSPGHSIYEKFGFKLHNGIDVAVGADKTIYAPFEGDVVRIGNQPTGGGIFVGILSSDDYEFSDVGMDFVLLDALHCESILVTEGQHVVLGQAIAIADNTGFSTGPHTHFQLRREAKVPAPAGAANSYRLLAGNFWLQDVDANDANNSFDPMPYATTTFAADAALANLPASPGLVALRDSLWRRVWAKFRAFFKGRPNIPPQ